MPVEGRNITTYEEQVLMAMNPHWHASDYFNFFIIIICYFKFDYFSNYFYYFRVINELPFPSLRPSFHANLMQMLELEEIQQFMQGTEITASKKDN